MPLYENHKRNLSQYYTPMYIARSCFNTAQSVIGSENIVEYLEPCAGTGVFLDLFDKPYIAYDVDPKDKRIQQLDFLKSSLEYKQGRLCLTNPPFNDHLSVIKFFNKASESCQYIAFILPISYLGVYNRLGKFKLLHSEDLGVIDFKGAPIRCCFNIYDTTIKVKIKTPQSKYFEVHEVKRCRKSTHKWVSDYDNILIQSWGTISIKKSINDSAKSCVIAFKKDCPDDVKQAVRQYIEKVVENVYEYFPHLNNGRAKFLSALQMAHKLKAQFPQYYDD